MKITVTLDRESMEKLRNLCDEMKPKVRLSDYVNYMVEREIAFLTKNKENILSS